MKSKSLSSQEGIFVLVKINSQGGPRSWEISLPTGEYPISDNREFPSGQGNGKFSILNLGY